MEIDSQQEMEKNYDRIQKSKHLQVRISPVLLWENVLEPRGKKLRRSFIQEKDSELSGGYNKWLRQGVKNLQDPTPRPIWKRST